MPVRCVAVVVHNEDLFVAEVILGSFFGAVPPADPAHTGKASPIVCYFPPLFSLHHAVKCSRKLWCSHPAFFSRLRTQTLMGNVSSPFHPSSSSAWCNSSSSFTTRSFLVFIHHLSSSSPASYTFVLIRRTTSSHKDKKMVQPLIVGNNDYGYPVSLTQERRANGMYIIGMNGMGKSVTMLSMLIQDIEQGRGLCLIDPHGDLVRDTMAYIPETRHDDVTLFDTRNPNLIPAFDLFAGMQASNVIERSEQISRVVAAFLKAAPSTNAHRMENLLRLITIAFLDTPGYTLAEMPLLIGNESFRSFLAGKVKDPQVRDDWARFAKMTDRQWEEYTESSMTRIRKFTTDPLIKLIIGQQGKAIDFRHAMDTGRIVLIKMPRNEEMANLLGTLLVDRLLAAALSRDKLVIKDRRLFSIYVDEFARFQTDDFPRFFTEGRKYGVPTTVAHQARWQLGDSDQAPRAAHNWLLFKCEFEDATVLGRGIPAPYEEPPKPLSPEGLAWRRLFDTFGYVHFLKRSGGKISPYGRT